MRGGWMALLAGLCATGCVMERPGPPRHAFQAIERGGAEQVRVNLNMGAGRLRIDTGTDKLVAADFTYSAESWKPEMRYDQSGGRGTLTISQPESHQVRVGRNEYEWDLRMNRDVPFDIAVNFGAGEAHLDVGGLTMRALAVDMGVGHLDLDLRGNPKQNYDVHINGGVGEAVVHLPSEVGIEADAHGGIGSIQAFGLRHQDNRYYNDAWENAKARIHLDIEGGVGTIRLLGE